MASRPPRPSSGPPDASGDPAPRPEGLSAEVLRQRWEVDGNELDPRYQLGDLLGRGGMGEVVRGHDHRLRRDVAIKLTRLEDAEATSRFVQEAQVTGQLDHPNIPPIHDLGLGPDGTGFFTMRALPGRTLSTVIKEESPLSVSRALELFGKVCDAVAYAHSRGVLHRDLKPGNVIVGDFGEVYVIDWGLARRLGPDASVETEAEASEGAMTREGIVIGTPGYMSPEQAANGVLDARSDVYALGAVLYALLTGRSPFGSGPAVLLRVHRGEYPPPRTIRRDLPWELAEVVRRAMALRPDDRYPTVGALQADLAAWREGRHLPGVRYGFVRRVGKTLGRHRRALVASLLVGTLAGGLGLTFLAVYAVTMEAARDRALGAEKLAEGRALEQQVALARFRGGSGMPAAARKELLDAVSRADSAGLDDRIAVFALASLDGRFPPPEVRVKVDGASFALDPDGDRAAFVVGRRVFVHELLTGAVTASWEASAGEVSLDGFADGALRVLVRDGPRISRVNGLDGRVLWSLVLPGAPGGDDRLVGTPDDAWFAWSHEGKASVFATATGAVTHTLDAVVVALSDDGARALAFHPRGANRQVERHVLLDVATGAELGGFPVGGEFVPTHDLGTLVSTAAEGAQAATLDGRTVWSGGPTVPALGLSGDGKEIAEFGTDGTIEVRDVGTGELHLTRRAGEGRGPVSGGPVLGQGWIAANIDGDLHLWSRATRSEAVTAHPAAALAIDVSADGQLVATSGWEGTVALWDWRSGVELGRWPISPEGVRDVAFSPDGGRLATGDRSGMVRIVDLATGDVSAPLDAGRGIAMGVRWVDAGHVVASYEDGHLVTWTLATGDKADLHGELVTTWGLALAGKFLVVAGRDADDPAGELWDMAKGERVGVSTIREAGYGAAVTADGRRWAIGRWGGDVLLVDGRGEHTLSPPVDGPVMSVALSADGSLLAAGLFDGQVLLYDTERLTEILSVQLLPAAIQDLVFVPGTSILLGAGGEPGAFATLDLDRTRRVDAAALRIEPGVSPAADPARALDRAELAWDWRHAQAAIDLLAASGTPAASLRAARVRLALGDRPGALAALAQDPNVLPGTLAAWRRSLKP